MTLDVRQDSSVSTKVHLDSRWSAPVTLELVDPSGVDVTGTGTATLSAVSTTVVSATVEVVTVASATGITPGVELAITTGGVAAQVRVSAVNGTAITVTPPMVPTPSASDTVVGVTATVAIPTTATADLGVGYQILITDDGDGTDDLESREQYNVVRRVFSGAYTAKDVRQLWYAHWPSSVPGEVARQLLVDDAVEEVRQEFYASNQYPTIYIDPTTFRTITETVLRRLIAVRYGLFPGDVDDRDVYMDSLEAERNRLVGRTIRSLQSRDENDDGAVDEPTTRVYSFRKHR